MSKFVGQNVQLEGEKQPDEKNGAREQSVPQAKNVKQPQIGIPIVQELATSENGLESTLEFSQFPLKCQMVTWWRCRKVLHWRQHGEPD